MVRQELLARLEAKGWTWSEDALCSPNGTMWLKKATPWPRDVLGFLADMRARRERIRRHLADEPEWANPALADVEQVLDILRDLESESAGRTATPVKPPGSA